MIEIDTTQSSNLDFMFPLLGFMPVFASEDSIGWRDECENLNMDTKESELTSASPCRDPAIHTQSMR
jgi:hypothetical protein